MNLFLHTHERGYSLNSYEIPLALVTGLPYALRHVDMEKRGGRLGHLVIAVIESMPLIGAIAALIERIFAACFSMPKPIPDTPLPKIRVSLPEPCKMPFRADSDKPISKTRNIPLPEPIKINLPEDNERLISKLIVVGKYIKEPGDTALGIDNIGDNQGTKETRRVYLEILNAGIDLFSDQNLERIKKENKALYETILIKAYGHVKSLMGRKGNTNLEGSCEALSILMLLHSVKRLRNEINEILSYATDHSDFDDVYAFVDGKYSNICNMLLFPSWGFILNSSDSTGALITIIKNYDKKLGSVEMSLMQACTAESTDNEIKNAFDRIVKGSPQIVCSGYDWHSEVIIFSQNEMIYHNRGALKENGKEIHVNEMENKFITFELLKSLTNRFARIRASWATPSDSLKLASTSASAKRTIERNLKDAKGGFCTHTQPKAAIYSLMSLNEGIKRYEVSRSQYKLFTQMHRSYFRDIFQNHPIFGLF